MTKQRTLKEYRNIDLALFGVMLVVCEYLIIRAEKSWFPGQPYAVSLAGAMTAIVYMRWGWWGGIHAALAGLVYCFFSGGSGDQYAIYIIGNLFSLAAVPPLLKIGKERVRTGHLSLVFPLAVLLLMQTGRMAVAMVLGSPANEAAGFFITDSLSLLFTFVIIWIARRLDGIYEDQKHYLLRLKQRQEKEKEVRNES